MQLAEPLKIETRDSLLENVDLVVIDPLYNMQNKA